MKSILNTGTAVLALTLALSGWALAQDAELGDWGVDTSTISTDIDPGDDFFRYVNEGWLEHTELPAGFSTYTAFHELYLRSEDRIEGIIQASADAHAEAGTLAQQVGDLYASYMDTDRINALGVEPLRAGLARISEAEDLADIAYLFGQPGYPSIVGAGVQRDEGDPSHYIVYLGQAGLTLPTRDYYLLDDERFVEYRAAYRQYIADMFGFLGMDDGEARADRIIALETALAEVYWTPAQSRDRVATYNPVSLDELHEMAPEFDWDAFLDGSDYGDQTRFVVSQVSAIQGAARIFRDTPMETWRDYLTFGYLNGSANLLSEDIYARYFDFWGRTMSGTAEPRPRDRRAIQFVNGNLGQAIGQIYVEQYFPPENKAQMEELVGYLRRALRERIETLEWMDDATRAEALAKLDTFLPKIAYPDVWPDYSDIEIRADDLFGNAQRINAWFRNDTRERLHGPIREWEWGMTPQTVNAYYNSTGNEVVFPAAILQAPFFDPDADPAVNFGGIGAVIGHEIGHGFDDQGSQSDGEGVLRNWWTEASREQFDALTDRIVQQYGGFSPVEGMHVDGELTLGENIGDIGGLSMAYRAYQLYLADHGMEEAPVLDGFTGDQRFFLSWAQVWRGIQLEDAARNQILSDPHSPNQYRANGVVRNMDAWYDAFGVTPDDALYLPPEDRVSIW